MIKTLNAHSTSTSPTNTAQIMSRYRPIAPKPEAGPVGPVSRGGESYSYMENMPRKFRHSRYLRTLLPRPTRSRKRGRGFVISPPFVKRARTHFFHGVSSSPRPVNSPARHLFLQGFGPGIGRPNLGPNLSVISGNLHECSVPNLVMLPLLPCSVPSSVKELIGCNIVAGKEKVVDLNIAVADHVPEEKNLLQKLQETTTNVIRPRPVRPVWSCISVKSIYEVSNSKRQVAKKTAEEVEEEVESEALSAVISDSNNRVRLANSAYKEMVGQPECSWLDALVVADHDHGDCRPSCKRICGAVWLEFYDTLAVPVNSSNGFSGWVRIEWGGEGRIGKKNCINAFCDVVRLCCDTKDYAFTWRFHTQKGCC